MENANLSFIHCFIVSHFSFICSHSLLCISVSFSLAHSTSFHQIRLTKIQFISSNALMRHPGIELQNKKRKQIKEEEKQQQQSF